jgi:hypothetical protein
MRSGSKPAFWNCPSTLDVNTKPAERFRVRPRFEEREAVVRDRVAVQIQPVPVKAPRQPGIVAERVRASDPRERNPRLAVSGIRLPEPLVAPEVGQTGIDADPRPRTNQERVGVCGWRLRLVQSSLSFIA